MTDINNKLKALCYLGDNWDGEGAEVPSVEAINRAKLFIDWAAQNNIEIEDIDADVMGGIAIFMCNKSRTHQLWLDVKNTNHDTLVASINNIVVWSKMFTNELKNEIFLFLETS